MVIKKNHEQNKSYTFKYMLLQQKKSYFVLFMIKEVKAP